MIYTSFLVEGKCCNVVAIIFYVIGNGCYVVVVRQEFRKKFLLVFAAEQTLFYIVCPAKLDHTCRCKSGRGNRQ